MGFELGEMLRDAVAAFLFYAYILKLKTAQFIYSFLLRHYETITMHSLKRASFNVTHLVFVHLTDANMMDAELPGERGKTTLTHLA